MVGALAKTLARSGHQVGVVTPLYLGIREKLPQLKPSNMPLDLPLGAQRVHGEFWQFEPSPGLTIYFLDQPDFYQRVDLVSKVRRGLSGQCRKVYFLLQSRGPSGFPCGLETGTGPFA